MTAPRKLDLTEERNPLLERVRFNVDVDTATPILVDNNLAQAEVDVNVRLLGTPYETGLSGQLDVREGGEIRLNERQLRDRARHHHVPRRAAHLPVLRSAAEHDRGQLRHHHRRVGHARRYRDDADVDPTLPEPDIMALLVTGRTLDEMRGEEFDVAREQVLSYLAGRVGSSLGRGLERRPASARSASSRT